MIALLGACLGVLFYQSFEPHQILFANDGPFGAWKAESNRMPDKFFGRWLTTTWIGVAAPAAAPSLTNLLGWILPNVLYFKIYAPLTLLFLGFCVWLFLRQQGFHPMVCALIGLAAGLNMHFFSTACWGLGTINIATGAAFLALTALTTKAIPQLWARAILAGLAVGLGMMEGFDVGAILSVYVGLFAAWQALFENEGWGRRLLAAIGTEVLMVFFAGFIAAHTITGLIGTQVEEVVSAQQDVKTKANQWNRDTQWSLPKIETLRLFTPGIFGFRMLAYITTHDHSSAYWGLVGQDPRIAGLMSDDPQLRQSVITNVSYPVTPEDLANLDSGDISVRKSVTDAFTKHLGMFRRQSGTGDYAGILVSLLAVFGVANLFCGARGPYTILERKRGWFWTLAVFGSLLTAWGRYGFVYAWLYRLPYFSTIRNPIKFLDPFHIFWLVLAAGGLECLYRLYLKPAGTRPESAEPKNGSSFERKWFFASVAAAGLAVVAVVIYANNQDRLISYISFHGFNADIAATMARFSIGEAGWFLGFFLPSLWLLHHILTGAWRGSGAKFAWALVAAIIIVDLGRADAPWVHYFDYVEKYSTNPVKDFLNQKKPFEQRVIGRFAPRGPGSSSSKPRNNKDFGPVYDFWMQNDFPALEIESLDFAQMSRMPKLDDAYLRNFQLSPEDVTAFNIYPCVRLWELTGTRYFLYDGLSVSALNVKGDPSRHSFRVLAGLNILPKPGFEHNEVQDAGDVTVDLTDDLAKGNAALIEFSNALPRAQLFARWQTLDPSNTLAQLKDPDFNPHLTVLIATNSPVSPANLDSSADPGTVQITDYHPRDVRLQADVKTNAVLLLNDRFARDWHVQVDHQPAPMLLCNFIMRGVCLTPGSHTVEFRYRPPVKPLYFSLAGWGCGFLLAGYLMATRKRARESAP